MYVAIPDPREGHDVGACRTTTAIGTESGVRGVRPGPYGKETLLALVGGIHGG